MAGNNTIKRLCILWYKKSYGGTAMDISIIGTGYVGLVTGACLADIGHKVICSDIDEEKITQLNRGQIPIYEPGLDELVSRNKENKRISFTCNIRKAIENSKVVFIAVGTPPDKSGNADLSFVFQVAHDIAASLNEYKVIVNKSTVSVGTAKKVKEIIMKNRTRDIPFSMVSNPEFLREGSAIKDVFEGDRIVIGVEDDEAAKIMLQLYRPLNLPMQLTDIASAELIKYASNAFLATKISFINELANLCEKVGADITEVAKGMGADSRIGSSFLKAGIGYGGSCFPKDVKAITATAEQFGCELKTIRSAMEVNQKQREIVSQKIVDCIVGIQEPTVALLGLSFKPDTDDIREAPSLYIIEKLTAMGVSIKAYDPIAMEKVKELYPDIEYCKDVYEACLRADAAVFVTEWDEFFDIDFHRLKNNMRQQAIIDARNIFQPEKIRSMGFKYVSIGRK